ncbi:MgtC/SapB family protein [Cellulosilyticum ruminicola]|uniref:MgtC/SapB family protein n=1 Tax=Cellulosilyticum ruminicola TaxID=425254 RepID=UPI0006CFB7D2|nr:MgtC/SapB family protein [Cellulosilyticum ruminicola]
MDGIEYLREFNVISVILRILIALICSGLIGVERGKKKQIAGFRTHILVCVGASLVMMTSQYMLQQGFTTDISRLGAQVISGIGFLGAGTIIVIDRGRVKGLTTAAGLWVCGCIGLAVGIGFYEGAIFTCILVLIIMKSLHCVDDYVQHHSKIVRIYVELDEIQILTDFLYHLQEKDIMATDINVQKIDRGEPTERVRVIMTLNLCNKCPHKDTLEELRNLKGIIELEEIS